nr:EAL domain-containing protein [Mesobacillus maritimus]
MKYTMRISITAILLIVNFIFYFYYNLRFSVYDTFAFLLNALAGWVIGYYLDKYFFSKKMLLSTKNVLLDYSYALDSVGDAIGITNEVGQFEYVNEAHAVLYGYKNKDEFSTKSWKDCYSSEILEEVSQSIIISLQNKGQWRGEAVGVKKDGTTFPIELTLSMIGETKKTICLVRDITEQKEYEDQMRKMAEHNELTNLPNRRRLIKDLKRLLEESVPLSVMFIDLNHFKLVNDTLGHDAGDELLKLVAERLENFQNQLVHVYHHGGDEFIVVAQINMAKKNRENIASDLINLLKEPFYINGNEVMITSSIGASCYPEHTSSINELIKMADTAMYYAKIEGKNSYKLFNNDLKLQLERKASIEVELTKAITNDEFTIYYQPKFNMITGELVGIEALLRWFNPKLGFVSPGEFIPVAEESGLIIEIGNWVIKQVVEQMDRWKEKGNQLVKVSVNVSQRQFRNDHFVAFIKGTLNSSNVDPAYFEIEITESVLGDHDVVVPKLDQLKGLGIGISIDDFGTGYSSLSMLKNFPIDTLKIDQSFVRDSIDNAQNNLLIKTIIEIGNILNLNVVAEGIETEEHLALLVQYDCSIGQGYYYSRPLHPADFEVQFLNRIKIHS